ncbi:unnamed protein product [Nezara viridula]|uniref:Uncharacterized protein n=1 Tax=Nezara viridula TaxID=85310 RepID=A0A9P0EGT1_NEZVI|nr:unnamed protein product [Nezara viridula]
MIKGLRGTGGNIIRPPLFALFEDKPWVCIWASKDLHILPLPQDKKIWTKIQIILKKSTEVQRVWVLRLSGSVQETLVASMMSVAVAGGADNKFVAFDKKGGGRGREVVYGTFCWCCVPCPLDPRAPSRKTYSETLASSPKDVTVVEVGPVSGAEGLGTAELVKNMLMETVRQAELGRQVVSFRARSKVVRVSLGSGDAGKRVVDSGILAGAGLVVNRVGKRRPRVMLFEVPKEVSEQQVLQLVKAQNFQAVAANEFGKRDSLTCVGG